MMEVSKLTRPRFACTFAQHQFQVFTGLAKEDHLYIRGFLYGSAPNGHTLVVGEYTRRGSLGRVKSLQLGMNVFACWIRDKDRISLVDAPASSQHVLCQSQKLGKHTSQCCLGLEVAARYACNDARIVNARAREGFVLIARGFERLDRRARQDIALLGSGFLKLDARAREDTVKLDTDARRNAARLQSIALDFRDEASAQLKTAAEKHWSDGALDADLRLADLRAKRRAMEDGYMALQLVKSIHNGVAKQAYERQNKLRRVSRLSEESLLQNKDVLYPIDSVESQMFDRLTALQDAYWDIASALSQADGIDYNDPEELELIIATLLDMDAVDGASSATMLAECAKSPDVATRQALANALGNAPSVWALGNAGMGALQRLAGDVNPAVAAAASKALEELKKQWQIDSNNSITIRADGTFLESLYPSGDDEDGDQV